MRRVRESRPAAVGTAKSSFFSLSGKLELTAPVSALDAACSVRIWPFDFVPLGNAQNMDHNEVGTQKQ
jgi:hypothetical protein